METTLYPSLDTNQDEKETPTANGLQSRIKALMSPATLQIKKAIELAGATHTENPMALPSEEIKARLCVL